MAADAFMNALSRGLVGYVSYLAPCRQRLIRHYMAAVPATLRRIAGVRARVFDWAQVIPRDSGEVQLALVGKGDKERHVLIPADIAKGLLALRGDASSSARVFPISERRINQLIKAAAQRAKVNPEASRTGFGTPTPATRSTTAPRLRWSAKRSALAKQIELGAPADVFISADLDWMDYLSEKGLIKNDSEQLWPRSSDAT